MLADVNLSSENDTKAVLAVACASLLTSIDAEETIAILKEPDDDMPQAQRAFLKVLFLLHGKLQKDKPWRISEEFIAAVGTEYISLKMFNSINFD